ncbi:MAG: hypothetical protein L0312_19495, partial [Acidobacteria bacterium]|nr:hypothetical protein [Acidobacteriota bacterium]
AALRGSFPEELGGLFLEEEIHNEEVVTTKTETKAEPTRSTAPAATPAAPPANHAPAEGKVAPRPGEKMTIVPTTTTPSAETATVEKLPEYNSPLTIEGKIEHDKQVQEALNKATAPETKPEPAAEAKSEKKGRAGKKKEEPKAGPKKEPKTESPAAKPELPAATTTEAAKPAEAPVPAAPATEADRTPTQVEFNGIVSKLVVFRDKLGGAGSPDSQNLKQFILKKSGQTDTKLITKKQWEDIVKILDGALDNADLKTIVKG